VEYTVEVDSNGMVYIPTLMMICSSIQVILRLLPQQFERLQCWHYRCEGFMKYTMEMGLGAMIYTLRSIDWFKHSKVQGEGDTHTDTQAAR
jgi:hypothetical protein